MKRYYKKNRYDYLCRKYIEYIDQHILSTYSRTSRAENQKKAKAFTRQIFPLIDSFNPAYKQIHRYDTLKNSRFQMLRALKVKHPNLIWHLYRDKIIHNASYGLVVYKSSLILSKWSMDDSRVAYYDEYEVSPFVTRYSLGDNWANITTRIDLFLNPYILVKNFRNLLEQEITNFGEKVIKVELASRIYSSKAVKGDKKELPLILDIENILNDV